MCCLTTVERNKSISRPQFSRQRRDATGWKTRPQQEAKALDTLKSVGIVHTEAWCLPCSEPHREDECPRRDEDSLDDIFINTSFTSHGLERDHLGNTP